MLQRLALEDSIPTRPPDIELPPELQSVLSSHVPVFLRRQGLPPWISLLCFPVPTQSACDLIGMHTTTKQLLTLIMVITSTSRWPLVSLTPQPPSNQPWMLFSDLSFAGFCSSSSTIFWYIVQILVYTLITPEWSSFNIGPSLLCGESKEVLIWPYFHQLPGPCHLCSKSPNGSFEGSRSLEWPIPTSTKDIRKFLCLTGYYRRFIRDYGKMTQPLTALSDFTQEFVIEWDVSGQGIGVILMQNQQPIAYFSKALSL